MPAVEIMLARLFAAAAVIDEIEIDLESSLFVRMGVVVARASIVQRCMQEWFPRRCTSLSFPDLCPHVQRRVRAFTPDMASSAACSESLRALLALSSASIL